MRFINIISSLIFTCHANGWFIHWAIPKKEKKQIGGEDIYYLLFYKFLPIR